MDNKKGRLNALIAIRSLNRMSSSHYIANVDKIIDNCDKDHALTLIGQVNEHANIKKRDMHEYADNNTKKLIKHKTEEHVNMVNMDIKNRHDAETFPYMCKREGLKALVVKKEE